MRSEKSAGEASRNGNGSGTGKGIGNRSGNEKGEGRGKGRTLGQLVRSYRQKHGGRFDHLQVYRQAPLREAISLAALSLIRNKKGRLVRHSHQTRIPSRSLEVARLRLLRIAPALARCRSFGELHETVSSLRRGKAPVPGLGDLTIYDISLRIGAKRRLEPDLVYLHRGARDGARALGVDSNRCAIDIADLPAPLRRLSARDAEDFLSVYARELAGASRR